MAYATAAQVRAILPTLLKGDDDLGTVNSGTYLSLHDPAFDVPTILKNSTALTKAGADYTFTRPRKITLAVAATGESFIAQCYYAISDTDVGVIIAQADRYIVDYFTDYTIDTDRAADWSSWLSAAIYLRQYATATEENLRRAQELWDMALNAMENDRDRQKKVDDVTSFTKVQRINK
jgi:hypothetical protein